MKNAKPDKKTLTVSLDMELYNFFVKHAERERRTMAGILREHILTLKRQQEPTA